MSNHVFRDDELVNGFKGISLLGLFPGSPAERAGLLPGDLIVAVNGMRTLDVLDYLFAKQRCNSAMQVVFVRGRAYYEATMHWMHDATEPTAETVAAGRAAMLSGPTVGLAPPRRGPPMRAS